MLDSVAPSTEAGFPRSGVFAKKDSGKPLKRLEKTAEKMTFCTFSTEWRS
jgi:hypothetical protein